MANFRPNFLNKDDRADVLIFNQIKDYEKLHISETVNWYIYNSLEINSQSHPPQEEGEMDFVLMIPNYGIIVIESKGQSDPGYNKGVWEKIKGNKLNNINKELYYLEEVVENKYKEAVIN